jgi:hypothetical protein
MADYYYDNGKKIIDNYTKSNLNNSIKPLLTFIFIRQLGESDGVRYYNENKQSVAVDDWPTSIIDDIYEKADDAQKKNISNLKILFSTTLANLRKSGWKENTPYSEKNRMDF